MKKQEWDSLKKQVKEAVKKDDSREFMRLAKAIIENKYNPGD